MFFGRLKWPSWSPAPGPTSRMTPRQSVSIGPKEDGTSSANFFPRTSHSLANARFRKALKSVMRSLGAVMAVWRKTKRVYVSECCLSERGKVPCQRHGDLREGTLD